MSPTGMSARVASALLVVACSAAAVVAPSVGAVSPRAYLDWGVQEGTSDTDRGDAVAAHRDLTYVGLLSTCSGCEVGDTYSLALYDDTGARRWKRPVEDPAVPDAVASGPAGLDAGAFGAVVGARLRPRTGASSFVVDRYTPDGTLLWSIDGLDLGLAPGTDVLDLVVVGDEVYLVGGTPGATGPDHLVQRVALATGAPLGRVTSHFGAGLVWTGVEQLGDDLVVIGVEDRNDVLGFGEQVVVRRVDRRTLAPTWTRTLDTAGTETADDVAVWGQRVYVTGLTSGRLGGQPAFGGLDIYLRTYDPAGQRLWQRQVGTAFEQYTTSVAATPDGPVLVWARPAGAGASGVTVDGYTDAGQRTWRRETGGRDDLELFPFAAAWNYHGLRVVGATATASFGPFQGGFDDGFLIRYRVQVTG